MDIQTTLNTIGLFLTLCISGLALWKAWKTAPKEVKTADVELSQRYNDLADKTLTRAIDAEKKVKEVQEVAEKYEAIIEELNYTVNEHDKEIAVLKQRVADQAEEISQLRKKIISQDLELLDLKGKLIKEEKL